MASSCRFIITEGKKIAIQFFKWNSHSIERWLCSSVRLGDFDETALLDAYSPFLALSKKKNTKNTHDQLSHHCRCKGGSIACDAD